MRRENALAGRLMSIIEKLECVHYTNPVPSGSASLTVLCLVFDKIHFPNVYLPKGDYDRKLLLKEIERLEQLPPDYKTRQLIGALKFIEYRLPLDGILEYPTSRDAIFGNENVEVSKLARLIHDAHFPPRKNFEPAFETASIKQLPGSEEVISHAGDFFYQAGAIEYANQNNLPLIDDGTGLDLPFRAPYKDNAPTLAALLAIESMAEVVLPDLPVLTSREIVEFRVENVKELQNFRSSMLHYARTLNSSISDGATAEDVALKSKFLVESEIRPSLHDLSRDLTNPNRPWQKRMADVVRVAPSMFLGIVTGGLMGTTVTEAASKILLPEVEARGDKLAAAKRNGLYYLLKAKAIRN